MSEILKEKRSFRRWWLVLIVLVVIAAAAPIALLAFNYSAERRLGAEVVRISEAGEALRFVDLHSDIGRSNTEARNDAYYLYKQVLSRLPVDESGHLQRANIFYRRNISTLPTDGFPADVREDVAGQLAGLQPALEKLEKAAGLPLSGFEIGIRLGAGVCKNNLKRVRTAFLLSSLRTLNFLLSGANDGAVNSVISTLRMMRIFDFHPTTIVYAAKMRQVLMVCDDVRLLLEHGRASEKSLAEVQKLLAETISASELERAFLAERVYQLELARNLIPKDIASGFLGDEMADLPERLRLSRFIWRRWLMRRDSVRYLRDMAWLISVSRQPWPVPFDAIAARAQSGPAAKAGRLIPSTLPLVGMTIDSLTFTRCTTLAIAVERYVRCHGRVPDSLDDLCPLYIDSVLLDPFTGRKLLYSHDDSSYTIYSAGINRLDDNGSIVAAVGQQVAPDIGLRIRLRQ